MTIIAAAIIFSFTTIEFIDYRRVVTDTSIVVDRSRGEKLTVNMNITYPRVPCYRECLSIARGVEVPQYIYTDSGDACNVTVCVMSFRRADPIRASSEAKIPSSDSSKLGRHGHQRRDPVGYYTQHPQDAS